MRITTVACCEVYEALLMRCFQVHKSILDSRQLCELFDPSLDSRAYGCKEES